MIHWLAPLPRRQTQNGNPLDFAMGSQYLYKLISELEAMKSTHEADHQARMDKLEETIANVKKMQKGDPAPKPIAGVDYPIPRDGTSPKHSEIVADVVKQIRQPKDGETPVINEDSIAKKAAKLITLPKPKDGKDGQTPKLEEIFAYIKKNLKLEHIPGVKNEIDSYRNQLAGKHYGRDTWARGGGSSSSGSGYQAPTSGVVDGVNKTFVWATAPNVIVVDQGRGMQKTSSDTTANWTGGTTTILAVAPTFDIFSTS